MDRSFKPIVVESFLFLRGAFAVLGAAAMGMIAIELSGALPLLSLSGRERVVLAGLSAASLIGALFVSQLRVGVDRSRRLLLWEQRRARCVTRHELKLDERVSIEVGRYTERRDGFIQPSTTYQVRLRTADLTLPLSLQDFPDEASANRRATELRNEMGLSAPSPPRPTEDIARWLREGGPIEAIRQLRARDGLSLEEATRRVREHR